MEKRALLVNILDMLTATVINEINQNEHLCALQSSHILRSWRQFKQRERSKFKRKTANFSDLVFRSAFRLSRHFFEKFVEILLLNFISDDLYASGSSRGVISPEMTLGVSLLVLAGVKLNDHGFSLGIHRSTVHRIFKQTVLTIKYRPVIIRIIRLTLTKRNMDWLG